VLVSAAAGTGVLAAGGPAAAARDSEAAADRAAVQDVRDATEQYRDVDRALADGFVATTVCTDSPAGGMGLHYVNPQRLGQPLDPAKPSVLLYRRVGSHLQLLAAEWFSPDPDQDLATDSGRPTLFGHPFDGPMAGHEPGMPIHFDLHVWAWHSNPSGDFSPWNPTISC
jgi:hypothetical protein